MPAQQYLRPQREADMSIEAIVGLVLLAVIAVSAIVAVLAVRRIEVVAEDAYRMLGGIRQDYAEELSRAEKRRVHQHAVEVGRAFVRRLPPQPPNKTEAA